jgi:hypothetical protein
MTLFAFLHNGIESSLVGLVRKAYKKTSPVVTIDGEADGALVIKHIKHATVSEVGGEPTLLKYLAGKGGEDKMEGFVEEHGL